MDKETLYALAKKESNIYVYKNINENSTRYTTQELFEIFKEQEK